MTNKPTTVKVLVAVAWLSLGAAALIVLLAILATAVPAGEGTARAFLAGALDALGYDHATFGAYEAGEVFGSMLFAIVPVVLLLFAVSTRRLWLVRTAAVLWIIFAAATGGQVLLPWVAAVLAFLPSVRRYFDGDAAPDEEAAEVVRAA